MGVREELSAALLVGLLTLTAGCAELPDRLDNLADAGRDFAVAHPAVGRTALIAARAALRKPQRLRVVCESQCLIKQ